MLKTIALTTLLLLVLPGASCKKNGKNESGPKSGATLRDINAVLTDHTQKIMALPGVVGLYIGAREDSQLCIRVMVVERTPELEKKIPTELEGHPVEIDVTGEIRPLD